jgi:hypothetical protein
MAKASLICYMTYITFAATFNFVLFKNLGSRIFSKKEYKWKVADDE